TEELAHPIETRARIVLSLRVETFAFVTRENDDVARELRDGGAPFGIHRVANPPQVLREHLGGFDAFARMIERPRGDRADHLFSGFTAVAFDVEQALDLAHELLVRIFV